MSAITSYSFVAIPDVDRRALPPAGGRQTFKRVEAGPIAAELRVSLDSQTGFRRARS
jgi:hypothetical protein